MTNIQSKSFPARAGRRWARVAWCLAAASVAFAVGVTLLTHSPMPYEDEWYSLDLFRQFLSDPSLDKLASLHNEHRILFPRLLFWADYAWAGGTGIPDVAATLLVQAAAASMYARLAWRALPSSDWRAAAAAVPFLLLFSLRQEENFAWSFQTQFVGVFAAGSLSVVLGVTAVSGAGRVRTGALAGSLALQVVAAFTMANGFMAGIGTAFAMACLRSRAWVLPAALSLACLAAYMHGFERPQGSPSLTASLDHPLAVATFACAYLGSFLHPGVAASAVLGLVGVLLLSALAWDAASGRVRDPAVLAMLGIATFVAASALLTALGRASNDFEEATASRYATGAATFWSAMLPVAARGLPLPRRAALPVAAALSCLLAGAAVVGDVPGLREMRSHAYLRSSDADGLALGLVDLDAFHRDESGDLVESVVPFLRDRGIGPFSGRWSKLRGTPLAAAGSVTDAGCPGTMAATARPALGTDAVVMEGKDPVRTFLPGPRRVFVADPRGRIAGFGSAGPGMGGGWTGYARATPGDVLAAYAASDLGRLCLLGRVRVAPAG